MDLLLAFILAMVLTMALIPALMRRAGALHVLDQPAERKVHARPMPRVGGIAMAVGVAVPVLLWLDLERLTAAYLASALIVLLFGVWDDRATLSPGIKFLGQLIAVHLVVLVGGVEIHSLTFASRVELPEIIAAPLTALFLLGVTNAINLSDGLDGLAGGTTFLCCVAIAVLSLGTDLAFISTMAVVVMGSLLGFLRYNSYPAQVFMGDGGSQFLGFTVGVLAVLLTQNETLPFSAALPLLLLGLPILDTLAVMAIRMREGRSPFSADKNHLHHRLLALGFDHFEAVAVIYLLQGALFLLAWQLRYHSDIVIVAVFLGFACALLVALFKAEHLGWRWRGIGQIRLREEVNRRLLSLKEPQRMPRWTAIVAMACILLYFAGVTIAVGSVGRDIGWLAVSLCTVLGLAMLQRSEMPGMSAVTQGALYVAVVIAVYLDHIELEPVGLFVFAKKALFPLLTTVVLLRLRLSRERRFAVTPLDLLVIFVALALPNLPGLRGAPSNLGLSVAKLVVLFYALEMLAGHSARTKAWLVAERGGVSRSVGGAGIAPARRVMRVIQMSCQLSGGICTYAPCAGAERCVDWQGSDKICPPSGCRESKDEAKYLDGRCRIGGAAGLFAGAGDRAGSRSSATISTTIRWPCRARRRVGRSFRRMAVLSTGSARISPTTRRTTCCRATASISTWSVRRQQRSRTQWARSTRPARSTSRLAPTP